MNLKSIFIALIIAFSPLAAGAVTITVDTTSSAPQEVSSGFVGTIGDFAFEISAEAVDTLLTGKLEATIVAGVAVDPLAAITATVEVKSDYVDFGDFSSMKIGSRAEIGDIVGAEPLFDPSRGSVRVQHFISFGGGDEISLFDFLFVSEESSLEQRDIDKIGDVSVPYHLRSLYTFRAVKRGAVEVRSGEILVRPSTVPVPAGIVLMGTALVGFGVIRRKGKKAKA